MANEREFDLQKDRNMIIANRFIKKQMPKWKSFFYKLVVIKLNKKL